MPFKLKITPTAFNDLQDSIDYYNKQQKGLGKIFKAAVILTFNELKVIPTSGTFMYHSVRYKIIKKFPHIILYELLEKDIIAIYRIFNTHQKPYW